MHKRDVEQVARDSGLDESEAGRRFFVLGGVVWAGWVIGLGVDDECPIYDQAEEPRTWYGVAFDVQWFQDQELAPSPITSSPT
jgi:hypothetical protein